MTLRKYFAVEKQREILCRLFDSLVHGMGVANELRHNGLISFSAWGEFEENCCQSQAEADMLPRYSSERARILFTHPHDFLGKELSDHLDAYRPWGDRFKDELFISKLLHLEEQRDACFANYREMEYKSWRKSLSVSGESCNTNNFSEYFLCALLQNFSDAGFKYDDRLSQIGFPVISRPLAGKFSLCWSTAEKRYLDSWPRSSAPDVARWSRVELCCYVCAPDHRGEPIESLRTRGANFIRLRLGQLVDGFNWSYSRANGAEQVSFCVAAYSKLFSIFDEKIQQLLPALMD